MPDNPIPLLEDTRWLVATALACWGAILSTIQFVLKQREGRTAIRASFGEILTLDTKPTEGVTALRVFNVGKTDVAFKKGSCWVVFRGDADYTTGIKDEWADPPLPVTLKANDVLLFRIPFEEVIEQLVVPPGRHATPTMMKALAIDAIGNQYETRWEKLTES